MIQTKDLLDRINTRHGAELRLKGRYPLGQNQGAYAIEDASGTPLVLKWQSQPTMLSRLERARAVTDRLITLAVPVPRYLLIGTFPDGATYWLQTALPGSPPAQLSMEHLQQLLGLNERQAGQALSSEQDWSWYVRSVVFAGEDGWTDSLRHHSPETRTLLSLLEEVTAGKEACVSRTVDLVHGDLGLDNVLVAGDVVTGMVDWDAAGCGDRALDLSKLLFYSYEHEPVRTLLWQRIIAVSGRDALVVYLAYNILAQLDWSIHHHSRAVIDAGVAKAALILEDVNRMLGGLKGECEDV